MSKNKSKQPTISVSMIVKNESSHLNDCLKSVQGVDEIVIVDTGSDDNTVEIAKKYTDKIFHGPDYLWQDDFAHSRNQSLDKCTSDWVLIIDADEVLQENGVQKIRDTLSNLDDNVSAVYFDTVAMNNHDYVHKSIRLFKNRVAGIRWKGAIHNYLNITKGYYSDIKLYYGYSDAHQKDPDRALRILTKVVTEKPSASREKYYLAREYWYRKDYKTAIEWYNNYTKTATFVPELADAHLMLARCYYNLKDYDNSRKHCLRAITINTNFKEAVLFMTNLSGSKNSTNWRKWAEQCTNEDVLFVRVK